MHPLARPSIGAVRIRVLWLLLLATSIACRPTAWTSSESLLQVPFETGWEVQRILLGDDSAVPFLAEGWGTAERLGDGTPVRWAMGPHFSLRLTLAKPRPLRLRVRIAPQGRANSLQLEINGRQRVRWELTAGLQVYETEVEAQALRAGANDLVFMPSAWDAPAPDGHGDRRRLAVLWHEFEWVASGAFFGADLWDPADGGPARVAPGPGVVDLPPRSELRWLVGAAPALRVDLERIVAAQAGDGGELEIAWRSDRGARRARRFRTPSDGVELEFEPGADARFVELSLRSLGPGRLRVVGPGLSRAPPEPSAAADRTGIPVAVGATTGAPDRPDILLYIVDTLRSDRLGAVRQGAPLTPAIEELARESIVFDRAVAQAPWTKSAVASILTGLLPMQHSAVGRQDVLPESLPTLAERLRQMGYQTAAVVANANVGRDFGFAQGFEVFHEPYRTGEGSDADSIHRLGLEWLGRRDRHRPFFLLLHVIEPHAPYDAPTRLVQRVAPQVRDPASGSHERILAGSMLQDGPAQEVLRDLEGLYDADVALLDERFAPFLAALRREDLLDDALFVFVADHGEEFWEHGSLTHGSRLNAEQLNVPLFIRLPGPVRPGVRRSDFVQQIDIAPTLLALAGEKTPDSGDFGRSLVPLLLGTGPLAPGRIYSHLELDGWGADSVIESATSTKLIRTRSGFWGSRRELYDLAADPGERGNLAAKRQFEADWLRARLDQLTAIHREPVQLDSLSVEAERNLRALGYIR